MSVTDPAQTDLGYTDPNPRRETPWSRSQVIVTPIVSVLLALAVGGLLIYIQGVNPLTAYWVLFSSALGDVDGLVTVMEKSTPLILTGLAFTVGLRTGLFNIGAQGQLLVGAIGAAWAGYNFQMPAIIHLPSPSLSASCAELRGLRSPAYCAPTEACRKSSQQSCSTRSRSHWWTTWRASPSRARPAADAHPTRC